MDHPASARPAVFLDRDGTLIEDPGYLSDPTQVRLLPGVAEALRAMEAAGFFRVIITNQSGIGRGMYGRADFEATQREVERQLALAGATVDATYHCPHTPEAGCPCRKPGTALFREAIAVFDLDPARSWCIGDSLRDLEPATELGSRAMLIRAHPGPEEIAAAGRMNAPIAADLLAGSGLLRRYLSGL